METKSSKVDTKEIIKVHKELKDLKVIGTKATNPTFGSGNGAHFEKFISIQVFCITIYHLSCTLNVL